MKKTKPSDLEMQILSVLWDKGASTAREVLDSMPDGKQRAYTSILSVMQVMEKKGLLTHTNRGTAHVYKPAVNKNRIISPFVRKVINEVFGGKPAAMMQALINDSTISDDDLSQIHQLLDDLKASKQNKNKKGK